MWTLADLLLDTVVSAILKSDLLDSLDANSKTLSALLRLER